LFVLDIIGKLEADVAVSNLPNLIANEVPDCLAEKCLERPDMTRFEAVQAPEDAQNRFLNQVLRLVRAARELRETSVSPAAQRRNASFDQHLDGSPVTLVRALQQLERRLDLLGSVVCTALLVAHIGLVAFLYSFGSLSMP
jgi:hypothetical protein